MFRIEYHNMQKGAGRFYFTLRYIASILRTWYKFHIKYPWVEYDGFVRVMPHTTFAKRKISMGHNVQFGTYSQVSTDIKFGNNILMAGRVCFIGHHDHTFNIPGQTIWSSPRGNDNMTIVESDVWIGHNSTIIAGVTISAGAVIAANSVVTKNIPPCEIWGGVPAKKIKDRFASQKDKEKHLAFLASCDTSITHMARTKNIE